MAVTVTDNRQILYQDGLTGITGASTSETSFFAESTGCCAEAYNIATGQIYFNSSLNTTTTGNELLYVWSAVVATQNGYKEATPADSSHASYIGDGTNNFTPIAPPSRNWLGSNKPFRPMLAESTPSSKKIVSLIRTFTIKRPSLLITIN